MPAPLLLVDASIYVFRAWFSMPDSLVDKQGLPINAVMGFFDFAVRLLKEVNADGIAFAFDESLEHSHRSEIYPPYKQNRDPAPDELKRQFQICRDLIRSFGICEIGHNRYEADDVIGTLVEQARAKGQSTVIVSADKDLTQLVRDKDIWWHYAKRERLDYDGVTGRFGVSPRQISEWLALTGDAVDNIPGVPGVGAVTAAKLLQHFETLDKLLENPDDIAQIPGLRRAEHVAGAIREHTETINLARQLTEIYCEVPLPEAFSAELTSPKRDDFMQISEELGFGNHRRNQYETVVEHLYGSE